MYIAYSAVHNVSQPEPADNQTEQQQHILRLKAYQATCNKFCKEIAAIQKYITGWVPTYPVI